MLEPGNGSPIRLSRQWRKSRRSGNNANCVEVAGLESGALLVRNSRYPDGQTLLLDESSWVELIGRVRASEFDLDCIGRGPGVGCITAYQTDEGVVFASLDVPSQKLVFTLGEWSAFTAGVCDGEFDLPLTV